VSIWVPETLTTYHHAIQYYSLMFEICVKNSFSAAHHLRGYCGSCEGQHGHNWDIEVTFRGEKLDNCGMLIDFRKAKKIIKSILNELDHKDLNKIKHFLVVNPTSENIAAYLYRKIVKKISNKKLNVVSVKVWETNGNCAVYYEKN